MISPLRYMGSKRALAPSIAEAISVAHPDATVVDVFAGTCAIATALVAEHRVVANDIHAFAEVIARTLLVSPVRIPIPSEAWRALRERFDLNMDRLSSAISARLEEEEQVLRKLNRRRTWKALHEFSARELSCDSPLRLDPLQASADFQLNHTLEPYCLFSAYFASAYFGIRQAAEIDSLRFAIDGVDGRYRDVYLFALLYAASHCSATPGHFAQFLVPRDAANTRYIARMRRRSIVSYFNEALLQLTRPACLDRASNSVFRMEATEFLGQIREQRPRTKLVLYADPPYSRAQYSRYYHVLETLVLYDYPAATGKGRYRDSRFETDFSRKAKVRDAMSTFVEAAAATGAPLYLSYPKNGLVYSAGGDILSILKQHYRKARITASVDLNHSTMGAAPGTAAIQVMEDVYYAEP